MSDKASIYNHEQLEVGDNSRIDDFCVISGKIKIGRNVHITPMCLLSGGEMGIVFEDFVTIAYGVKIFTQSDDYSGETLTNSTVPSKYKKEKKEKVIIGKHSIIGTGSTIFLGVTTGEGTSIGAMSLVLLDTESWHIYVGSPAKKVKIKENTLLELEKKYLNKNGLL